MPVVVIVEDRLEVLLEVLDGLLDDPVEPVPLLPLEPELEVDRLLEL